MTTMTEIKQKFKCEFCEKEFSRESTLVVHLCEMKRRFQIKDEKSVKLGFAAYQRFLELNRKPKESYEVFCRTNFYAAFTKFGRHLQEIKPINVEEFVDFVIKSNIRLDDWTKDFVYREFLKDFLKREPIEAAIERSINMIQKWADESKEDWRNFFRKVSPTSAIMLIRLGRLSPWFIYNAESSREFFSRLNLEQIELINEYIDQTTWKIKFNTYVKDVDDIKKILKGAGL